MNLNILSLLLGLVGQGMIIAGFLLFRGNAPDNIIWLDIVVSSIVFWLVGTSLGLKPIDMRDPSQKQVGGLGLKWYSTMMYAIFSIGFMIFCGLYAADGNGYVAFKWQIAVQAVLLFLLLMGLLSSGHATKKTEQVYKQERQTLRGKEEIRYAFNDLSYTADSNPNLPARIRAELKELSDETRYLTPSSNPRAQEIDERIYALCNRLKPALNGSYELNRVDIDQLINQLRIEFRQRKQTF